MDSKLTELQSAKKAIKPRSGWLKAVRQALGLSTRQLASLLKTDMAAVLRLEERETKGTVTIESLERAARAMNCKLIYAIVPDDKHESFDAILDQKSLKLAERLVCEVDHTMRLENQGVTAEATQRHVKDLALELKADLDQRLWRK